MISRKLSQTTLGSYENEQSQTKKKKKDHESYNFISDIFHVCLSVSPTARVSIKQNSDLSLFENPRKTNTSDRYLGIQDILQTIQRLHPLLKISVDAINATLICIAGSVLISFFFIFSCYVVSKIFSQYGLVGSWLSS
jgi:hypothetical protein